MILESGSENIGLIQFSTNVLFYRYRVSRGEFYYF